MAACTSGKVTPTYEHNDTMPSPPFASALIPSPVSLPPHVIKTGHPFHTVILSALGSGKTKWTKNGGLFLLLHGIKQIYAENSLQTVEKIREKGCEIIKSQASWVI